FVSTDPPLSAVSALSLHDALPISILLLSGLVTDRVTDAASASISTVLTYNCQDLIGTDTSPLSKICLVAVMAVNRAAPFHRFIRDRKSTRLNSSHVKISYAVFCLK